MRTSIERLKRRSDFLRVAAAKRRFTTPGLVLQVLPRPRNGDRAPLRVGFTVTKKVGKAVVRNRTRRRLRAAAAAVLPNHGPQGHDLVLIGRNTTNARPFGALVGDLETALHRLKVWRREPDEKVPDDR